MKSFKIEGRLKGPEYVAITTRAYRLAVDAAWQALHTPQDSLLTEGAGGGGGVGGGGQASEQSKSKSTTSKQDLEGVRALKKKIASTSTSTSVTSSDRYNGVDEALMRDLRQVFARGQDQDYDGLSAGMLRITHTHTNAFMMSHHVMLCHILSHHVML